MVAENMFVDRRKTNILYGCAYMVEKRTIYTYICNIVNMCV